MRLECVTTTFPNNRKTVLEQNFLFREDTETENQVVNLYPEIQDQVFEGFGGAFTDSAGYVYAQMPEADQKAMLSYYFDADKMNYQIGRIHLDSCDFALEHYEAMSDPTDREMKSFSLERMNKYILPLLRDAQAVCKKPIELMVSPWSPPAFMKSTGERNQGGALREEYQEFWADYICKYIIELKKLGFRINRMSLQNEPKAVQAWDSCVYTAGQEKAFLRDYMYPALQKQGLAEIEIFIWDHNKERLFDRALAIIDKETDHMVAGIAFHWYSGDHFEALDLVRKKFPGKKLILSEACIEYNKFDADDYLANAQKYAHDTIGNLNGGMNAFYDWNIILDQEGGPNHVKNFCDAPFMFDMEKQELAERNTAAYIWHFSHFILPGAVRIAHTKYTDKLDITAFLNTDGTIVTVLLNRSKENVPVVLRTKNKSTSILVQSESIMTGKIIKCD